MIIIWGTKTRKESLGTVADWCPSCDNTQAFTVSDYYRVGHVYYISLGRGTHIGTVRQCWECESQYYCNEEDYDEFLPEKEAEQMPMSELLRRTNRSLKERLEDHDRASAESRGRGDTGGRGAEIIDALPADDQESTP